MNQPLSLVVTDLAEKTTGKIVVEKGIPIPKKRSGQATYPWRTMEIGDSFLVPPHVKTSSCRVMASVASKRYGGNFTSRKTPDGHRIWRVS